MRRALSLIALASVSCTPEAELSSVPAVPASSVPVVAATAPPATAVAPPAPAVLPAIGVRGAANVELTEVSVSRGSRGKNHREGTDLTLEVHLDRAASADRFLGLVEGESKIVAFTDDGGESLTDPRAAVTLESIEEDGSVIAVELWTPRVPRTAAQRVVVRAKLALELAGPPGSASATLSAADNAADVAVDGGQVRVTRKDGMDRVGFGLSGPRNPVTFVTLEGKVANLRTLNLNGATFAAGDGALSPSSTSNGLSIISGVRHDTFTFAFPRTRKAIRVEIPFFTGSRQVVEEVEVTAGLGR